MAKQSRQQVIPQTSLFPCFPEALNSRYAGLGIAALYFVLMLFISLNYHIVGDYNVETDFYWSYVPQAKHILEGMVPIEDYHGPAYPMVLAFISLFTRDLFHAGVALSTLAAAVSLFLIFELLKKLFRSDVAFLGTLLVAANTTFVRYSYTAGTDMLFVAFMSASTFFLLRDEQLRRTNVVLSACFAAIGYLTRYNGLSAAVGIPLAVLVANPFQQSLKDRIKTSAIFLGVFLAVIAPWGIYCQIQKGSFFYNRNYLNIAYEMFAKGKIGWDQYWYGEAQKFTSLTQVIFADPVLFTTSLVKNLIDHAVSDFNLLLGWQVGVFSLLGIAAFVKYRPTSRVAGYFLISAAFFGVLLLVFYGERFSMTLLPVYAVLALKALSVPSMAQFRFWKTIHAGGLIAIILIVWTCYDSTEFNRANIDSGPKEVLSFGSWSRQNLADSERGKIVIARKPHIAYYLDMKLEMFPYVENYDQLLVELRRVKASYLYFSLMEAGMRPQFRGLLDPRNAPKELRPLTYTTNPPAVLYKVELGETP
ncbi:MAG: glycosyltransferase family 39 protein [Ignavibacteriales bacterium]|nr:glycosyltransferase family 39 protein [Ignavibacteriales bacterium]